ncbi:MAG: APC family permease [Myxococcota bacterium]|nr:APC family permease [Myxococcota bacterium]
MTAGQLERAIGVPGAVLMGLGSILGTGIFVSVGIAAGIAGPAVLLAIPIAAVVAICNGLSSAQLAASHPVSGGTYEYGYRYLGRPAGLVAGWTFLIAKSASAATAALGFASYLFDGRFARLGVALGMVAATTFLVSRGISRTARANAIVVAVTLAGLATFVISNLTAVDTANFAFELDPTSTLHASALLFVAFAGYGRIATLGEEVRDPQRTIPRAVILALIITLAIYIVVVCVGIGAVGAPAFAATATPLETASSNGAVRWIIALAATTAMEGVLLNLVLGLSRVVLAMGRRGDLPRGLATIDDRKSPRNAVIVVGIAIGLLVLIGDVKLTWSVSAFSVLLYYAITNAAALRLPPEHRKYPRAIAAFGLVACIALAAFVVYALA